MTARRAGGARVRWISFLGVGVLRLLALTWRVRFVNDAVVRDLRARRQPFIHVLWHGQLLPLLWTHRGRGISLMISEHRDGEIIARVAMALGFRTVRGSTSRGAARALLGASQALESGCDIAVTVDGPRGPAGVVAPGAPVISHRTGAPMVPTAASASRAWRLRSWDRFLVPKPFARIVVAYGEPIIVRAESARDASEQVDDVARGINTASDVALASQGGSGGPGS
jgi:lysophospholipid acyltransferase (LPLAT)-like uncharacterized protein